MSEQTATQLSVKEVDIPDGRADEAHQAFRFRCKIGDVIFRYGLELPRGNDVYEWGERIEQFGLSMKRFACHRRLNCHEYVPDEHVGQEPPMVLSREEPNEASDDEE